MRRRLLPALILAGLLAPAGAHAEDLYVSATSDRAASSCPILLPCTLPAGLAAADQPGDVVHVWNGTYELPQATDVKAGVTVVGDSTERPLILGDLRAEPASGQTPTRLQRLDIAGEVDLGDRSEGVDLIVRSTSVGVDLSGGKLHQSLVVATGPSAVGVRADRNAAQVTSSTVIASGPGARGILAQVFAYQSECFYQPPNLVLDVRNVIARGTAADLAATGSQGDGCSEPARMTVSYSNFRTAVAGDPVASITQGAGNQTSAELTDSAAIFADTTRYRQKDGAPTHDAGAGDPPPGPADLDGHPRVQEGGIDIGADELPAPPRAVTSSATDVGQSGAALQAVVTPNAAATHVVFDYGPTGAYGSTTAPQPLPSGGSETSVQARVDGLAAGTTFNYRVRAYNPADAVQPRAAAGDSATFATPALPPRVVVAHPPPPLPDVLAGLTAKKSLKLAAFSRTGLRVGFRLGRPGTAYAVKLTARLRRRTVTLARARGSAGPGARTVVLEPSRRTVALLRRFKRVKAKLVVTAGSATASRAVTIRR